MTTWSNWSGLETAVARRTEEPRDTAGVVAAVERARTEGSTVKMVGSGHSFTPIAAPEHTMLRPDSLAGLLRVDREAMTVTARSGTRLKHLNALLASAGLSLHNMGDIAEQTLAGAVSTGTHGSGGTAAGLAAQLDGFTMVTGTGEVVHADRTQNPDLFDLGRVGLGALGVLTDVTFRVEPLFCLRAEERPASWSELLDTFDDLTREHHHVDVHWFPHTDGALLKANTRVTDPPELADPPSALRSWWDDDFISNTVFGAVSWLGSRRPELVPKINGFATQALSPRSYTDVAHRVFVSPRRVVFREMEYALPREVGLAALREVRRLIDASDWRIGFPVEVRTAPADDVALSTAHERDSLYLAFHVHRDADHRAFFAGVEAVMRAHGGRPHWGKLHTLAADDLRELYPRFDDFLALRDRLDPDRVLANPYLRRVLGD
ncbi:FAD-binding protein [Nocardioides sp. Y6]|uniref:FAD-binding protein n=1 Tax=Nocardioides malaquae TaxID=2773426 RepID=A0ABR9RNJ7_9ACTN|nr:D-arabinono-1,4-lactone oxidase [Nocardioides malaquae]MBE7323138.1 FAD-binding protein [Nocardioides malaquae]